MTGSGVAPCGGKDRNDVLLEADPTVGSCIFYCDGNGHFLAAEFHFHRGSTISEREKSRTFNPGEFGVGNLIESGGSNIAGDGILVGSNDDEAMVISFGFERDRARVNSDRN